MAVKKTTEQFAKELLDKRGLTLISPYTGAARKVSFACPQGHVSESTPTNLLNRVFTCKTCKHGHEVLSRKTWQTEDVEYLTRLIHEGTAATDCAKIFKTTEAALRKLCEAKGISFRADNIKLINKVQEGLKNNGYTAEVPSDIHIEDSLQVLCTEQHNTIVPIKALLYYGKTCSQCKHEDTLSRIQVILKEQNRVVDPYSYIDTNNKVAITCQSGHTVQQYAGHILYKKGGCGVCFVEEGISNAEKSLRKFIESQYNGWIVYNDRTLLEGKELDIVIPDYGLAFEFNGTYWHQEGSNKPANYHKNKTDKTESNDYQLIHISDYLWENKQDIVKSRIKQLLHLSERISARKTNIKEIAFPRDFLEANHIQGAGSPTSTNYALYYQDVIVAVMTFGKPRFTSNQEWELVRFATKQGVSVQGGASKLFKYFIRQHSPNSIVSYASRDFSKGNLYSTLGFKHQHNTEPGYAYYDRRLNRISRYQAQKHKLEKLLTLFDPKLQESENMQLNGYYKVYDQGNMVFSYVP